jgi:DNA recombination protein Rad52
MDVTKVVEALEAKIPREAVSLREAGRGQKLSYLETWYVIDRMNKVFGNLNWSSETVENRMIGTTDKGYPIYVAKVRIIVNTPNGSIFRDGTGYGVDKSGLNAHEMAAKEAESDAFKRAAMKYGTSMGLALYDKTQENVEDTAPVTTTKSSKTATKSAGPVAAPRSAEPSQRSVSPVTTVSVPAVAIPTLAEPTTTEEALMQISSLARVVTAKKKLTLEELKLSLQSKYGVEKKEQLNLVQAKEFCQFLKEQIV